MKVAILTTGGTFDKVYFDANSEYSIGDPCITSILDEGNVNSDYRIQPILKKDSLDITSKERQIIKNSVQECVEERIIIIHGTDTMVETAKSLEDIKDKAIVLTGAMQPARFKKTDAIDGGEFILRVFSADIPDTELPGSIKFPIDKEIVIAKIVVKR